MKRYENNPILSINNIKPSRPDFEVVGVFNAGVTSYRGKTLLLLRVAERPTNRGDGMCRSIYFDPDSSAISELVFDASSPDVDCSDSRWIKTPNNRYITSISHFRIATSDDAIHFTADEKPTMQAATKYEKYGIEDPRITRIGDKYYICYSAISDVGITVCLAVTEDFVCFERLGAIFHPDNKDVAIFPEKIGDYYYALNRPSTSQFGTPDIWLAQSKDLICWGNYQHLMGPRMGTWDDGRVGSSAVPIKTDKGWLEIYHGATKDDVYCLGAVLLDLNDPSKIISRGSVPILSPEAPYEMEGFFKNVVFSCGVLQDGDVLHVYYGAADCCVCYARASLAEILESLE